MKLGRLEVCYIAPVPSRYERRRNINYRKVLIALSGMLGFAITQMQVYAYDESLKAPLKKIGEAEDLVLDYGFALGRLVCVVMCTMEIVKSIKDGDANAFWGIILKYAIALGSFKLLPWIFDMIAGFFG